MGVDRARRHIAARRVVTPIGRVERLENRRLLAAQAADVAMLDATTLDSKGVTVDYVVKNADLNRPLVLGVYRSAVASLAPGDVAVGSVAIPVSALDAAGKPATAVGAHHLDVALPGGLPPNPLHPYVVVAADIGTAAASRPDHAAAFRVYTIGVIVHGGIQPKGWTHSGPPWEATMAASLRAEGYDVVIPYNWVGVSSHAGSAAKQGPRLARMIAADAMALPPNAPVDLHIIGHSEGTVVASRALNDLQPTPGLAKGYIELTYLDPHAASNGLKAKQVSVAHGLVGAIAKGEIDAFQSKAKDPTPYIPANVDDAQVYFQRTPVGLAHTNGGIYNLWGQVPVPSAPGVPVHYADLTGPGVSHAGDFGVFDWYQVNVVPLLGNGPVFVDPSHLTAHPVISGSGPTGTIHYAGEAFPGATVHLIDLPLKILGSKATREIGRATADANGQWTITTLAPADAFRYVVRADVPVFPGRAHVYSSPSVTLDAAGFGH